MGVKTFGSRLKTYHILISHGVWFPDGSYHALGHWDPGGHKGRQADGREG